MPVAQSETDSNSLVSFGDCIELSKIFHSDFDVHSDNKKHVVIISRNLTKNELLELKILKNPYLTKEIFVPAYNELSLNETLSDQEKEFLWKHDIKITSVSDGGLANYIHSYDKLCLKNHVAKKSFLVEGGPIFIHHLLDPATSPQASDLPIDTFLITKRWNSKNPIDARYLAGKPFSKSSIERIFEKATDSQVWHEGEVSYRTSAYVNRSLASVRGIGQYGNDKAKTLLVQQQINDLMAGHQ